MVLISVLIFEDAMSTVEFCTECNNLLYPREDPEKKNLLYGCNNCDYEEPAESNIVYYKEFTGKGVSGSKLLNSEPVLPVTKNVRCKKCGHNEATFFQAPPEEDAELTLYFVCTNPKCGERWHD